MSAITPDSARALTPSGNLRRRQLISRLFVVVALGSTVLAVGVLAVMVIVTISHGAESISWSFLTGDLPTTAGQPGGVGPAIVGTFEISLLGALIGVPIGILSAMFVNEFAPKPVKRVMLTALDVLTGLPPIVIGLFVWATIVASMQIESAFAGAIALAVVIAPLVARSTIESLQRFPTSWREASAALGIARWRILLKLVLPASGPTIVTAAILAVARAVGDVALLLLTTGGYSYGYSLNPFKPMASLPLQLWTNIELNTPTATQYAWGCALVLMVGILLINLCARIV